MLVSKSALETVSGKFVDVLNPSIDDIDIDDIAWHLSRLSRYCGGTITEVPYNVGHHSIFVMRLVREQGEDIECQKAALLHDAAEYLINDIPSPVKHLPKVKEAIDEMESNILSVIFKKFEIDGEKYAYIIHEADMKARAIEAYLFMSSRGKHWNGLPAITLLDIQKFGEPWASVETYQNFKYHWEELNDH